MSRSSSTCVSTFIAVVIAVMVPGIVTPGASVAGELRVEVASDPQVTPVEAVIEASRRFEATLLAELLRREPRLTPSRLHRALPRLWTATEADHREQTVELLKPYGTLYRRQVRWSLSDAIVRDWLNGQLDEDRQRQRGMLIAIGFTILGWLAGGGMVLKLDHLTRGYRRAMIIGVAAVLMIAATMGGWQLVLTC